MRYLECRAYREDIETTIAHIVNFDAFRNKRILVLGASGLIGSFITDCFLYADEKYGAGITVYAVSRNAGQLRNRFGEEQEGRLHFIEADVTDFDLELPFDFMIHAASYGHPQAFREVPVEVFLSNVIGTDRVMRLAEKNGKCRVLYISSGEVQEEVDHMTARACYPMGKRAAETLCVSYNKEYGTDVVIARPCHTFGANVTGNDNRASAQFIALASAGKNIEMYSAGEQRRSFAYVADCASGLLTVLAGGEGGQVYGISSGESCTVRAFAEVCAGLGGSRVEMHLPSGTEIAETSPIKEQIVENGGLKALGWQAAFSVRDGIRRSLQIIKEMGGI